MRDLLAGSSLPVASAIVFNVVRRREIESRRALDGGDVSLIERHGGDHHLTV
jgi:hypothetical protein